MRVVLLKSDSSTGWLSKTGSGADEGYMTNGKRKAACQSELTASSPSQDTPGPALAPPFEPTPAQMPAPAPEHGQPLAGEPSPASPHDRLPHCGTPTPALTPIIAPITAAPLAIPFLTPIHMPTASVTAVAQHSPPSPRVKTSLASNSPASNSPVLNSSALNSPTINSPAGNSPEPAATNCSSSGCAAGVRVLARVGLQGHPCWSQAASVPAGFTVGAVWAQAAAFLGIQESSCTSVWCDSQAVSAADHPLPAVGGSDTVLLDIVLKPEGQHTLHLRMVDANGMTLEGIFLCFEQVGLGLQRWAAGVPGLPFQGLCFLHDGQPIDTSVKFQDMGMKNSDVINVMVPGSAKAAAPAPLQAQLHTQVNSPSALSLVLSSKCVICVVISHSSR